MAKYRLKDDPISNPARLPISPRKRDSQATIATICLWFVPNARRIPNSRVRSSTPIRTVFKIPIATTIMTTITMIHIKALSNSIHCCIMGEYGLPGQDLELF